MEYLYGVNPHINPVGLLVRTPERLPMGLQIGIIEERTKCLLEKVVVSGETWGGGVYRYLGSIYKIIYAEWLSAELSFRNLSAFDINWILKSLCYSEEIM
jgi:hypothetical protein